ncbi:uncharacterized protein LOC134286812 [Aedes albopictus]|uniref:Integrase zinc-binding domain-containing protein n=1 Tax=Aedes albopictus TaxID=7160 RepID=A0ABM1YNH5_AEDAL
MLGAGKSPSVRALQFKLKEILLMFNDIQLFVSKFKDDTRAIQIQVRLGKVDELWNMFSDTLVEIISHEDYVADEDKYAKERQQFSSQYYTVKAFLLEKLEQIQQAASDRSTSVHDSSTMNITEHVRLPQIRLQSFKGDIDEWISFRDLFTSLIHSRTDLPDVEKLHYLKGCLLGEPKGLIDPLAITAANYNVAWSMITKRYDNSKQLRKRQIQSLFGLPHLVKESVTELQALVEGFERSVRILDQIVEVAEYKDLLLVNMLSSRLDPVTRRSWEEQSSTKDKDTIKELVEFLQRRIQVLASIPSRSSDSKVLQTSAPRQRALVKASFNSARVSSQPSTNCQGSDTVSTVGNSASSSPSDNAESTSGSTDTVANVATSEVSVCNAAGTSSQVFLATAVIVVEDNEGNQYGARTLLDSGSECNFVSERLCQLLKVVRSRADVKVQGIGQTSSAVKHQVQIKVRSRLSSFARLVNFLVLPKVTVNLPASTVDTRELTIPEGIQLADPGFFKSSGVDMILGIELFFSLFDIDHKISLGDNLPTLIDSVFGWVVCGTMAMPKAVTQVNCNLSVKDRLEDLLTRFWECEEVADQIKPSPEERICEEQYQQSVQRAEDGRYIVGLPKDDVKLQRLGTSRDIALRRFYSTERRLDKDSKLRQQYVAFMDEYLQLQHMKEVQEIPGDDIKRCYLPHHPVVKEASTTTKVRVVFDASCRTSSGISLNDTLYAGPVIQEDLRAIIMRGRTRQIMVVADVEKMFRQIWTRPEDRHLQCILWRSSPVENVKTYELATVTYGTKPAPFLATRTLHQLATDEGHRFPSAAVAIKEDTYMDDVITGADNVEEAVNLRTELQGLTEAGGFHLRKWASNCPKVLDGVSLENLAIPNTEEVNLESNPSVTTLGLVWVPGIDKLKFKFQIPALNCAELLTKRKILSTIATLFDPTGLVGAVVVEAKIFMQRLWTLQDETGQRLDWDQPVPSKVGEEWCRFYEHLPRLQEIEVNRCVIIPNAVTTEVHCFSDASMKAYGACLYLRSQDASGNVFVRLLASRSKVAPLKTQSLPRLELCGALLGTQLCQKVREAIRFNGGVYFWTDSTCVLRWIAATPATWTTFVANRVSKIQGLSDGCHWRHVKGTENPADLISRGVNAANIINYDLWWSGPYWLQIPQEQWPVRGVEPNEEGEEERRRCATATTVTTCDEFNQWFISLFDTYDDLIRRTAFWLRLMDLLKLPRDQRTKTEFLTITEKKRAEQVLIRRVQMESFPEEWKALSKGLSVSSKSPLRWFHPYISKEDGLLRIGGRLSQSQEPEDKKHPPILPARHIFTRKLLQSYHERLLHAGPQLLLATVRLKYWPLGGRSLARQLVHNCLRCYRSKPSTVQQFMGDLPQSRVTASRPFSRVGVDYFGPVYVRPSPRRAAVKAYVALFVCFCTKAIHMELVTDLSTERFIQALRRFISRRGKPSDIFSDNGTNFVGAKNQLVELRELLRSQDCLEKISKEFRDWFTRIVDGGWLAALTLPGWLYYFIAIYHQAVALAGSRASQQPATNGGDNK